MQQVYVCVCESQTNELQSINTAKNKTNRINLNFTLLKLSFAKTNFQKAMCLSNHHTIHAHLASVMQLITK